MNIDFDRIKSIQIDMLKKIIDICNSENIKYFLVGGSALGAVRHRGFIPWDDDIDVGMPRKDYEKFISCAPKYLPDNMFLQTAYSDERYPLNFAKLRRSDTTFKEASYSSLKINHGVYLDIFPLDGYTSGKLFHLKNKLLNMRVYMAFDCYEPPKNIFKRLIRVFLGIIYKDYKTAVFKREKLIKKIDYESSEEVINYCGAWGDREIMPQEYFGEGVKAEFEGLKVIIPSDYDKYLTRLYGDFMKLPPEEKRVPHHECTIIDLDKSYKEYEV